MSLSQLPLSYCTNVHPGLTLAEIESGLTRYTSPVRDRVDGNLAAGLWLSESVVRELTASPAVLQRFRGYLEEQALPCYTLNAFPFGNFHSERVKENVYLPDWTAPERLAYTLDCARVLAELLPPEAEGSISTVPLGFKSLCGSEAFEPRAMSQLIACGRGLDELFQQTGQRIRLAIEPEPLCVLETTDEAIGFFGRLMDQADHAGCPEQAREYLGLCYDVCHQSVEFEDVKHSLERIDQAGIRLNKIHITCAIELRNPMSSPEGRAALANFVEPRYLHQTTALSTDGRVSRWPDLTRELLDNPPERLRAATSWRIHYHVPVDAESLGPLETTRPDLKRALETVAALEYAPHLEVETYTWNVLPGAAKPDLVEGLTREVMATRRLLENARTGGHKTGETRPLEGRH